MEVVTISFFVPPDQPTIFEFGEDKIESLVVGAGPRSAAFVLGRRRVGRGVLTPPLCVLMGGGRLSAACPGPRAQALSSPALSSRIDLRRRPARG